MGVLLIPLMNPQNTIGDGMNEHRYTAIKRTAYCPICGKKTDDARETVDRPPGYGREVMIICDCGYSTFSSVYDHNALMDD